MRHPASEFPSRLLSDSIYNADSLWSVTFVPSMHHSYEQRVCIVTGGASGLGKELCRQLGGAGALVIIADIDESRGQIAADEIAKTGGVALAIPVDVTKSHSVQSLFEKVVAQFGRIDYIFNNAGVGIWGEFRDITLDQWCRVLDVNLIGVINS